jgi:hypothetical protein
LNGNYNQSNRNGFQNKNHFCNLTDFDLFVMSEPGEAVKTKLSSTCDFTEWDYWLIHESDNMTTLEDVLNNLKTRSGSVCTMMASIIFFCFFICSFSHKINCHRIRLWTTPNLFIYPIFFRII